MTASETPILLGMTYVPYLPPEHLRDLAQAAEASGLDELWVWEDCFKQSGIASAAAALAWTSRIRVGIGLLPVPLRNVPLAAMELATLERLFPGRLIAGIGHGVQAWMAQAGVRAESPLTLLREYATALRALLAGEQVTTAGQYVRLDRVALDWPPVQPPPLMLGGAGPKSIDLAAELGDGSLLGAALDDEEVAAACARIRAVPQARTRPGGHPVVGTVIVATGPGAEQRVAGELAHWGKSPGDPVGAAGDADTVAATLARWARPGVTSIAVQPTHDEPDLLGLVTWLGTEVRPRLRERTG